MGGGVDEGAPFQTVTVLHVKDDRSSVLGGGGGEEREK